MTDIRNIFNNIFQQICESRPFKILGDDELPVDPVLVSTLGYKEESQTPETLSRIIHPADFPHLTAARESFLKSNDSTFSIEFRMKDIAGKWHSFFSLLKFSGCEELKKREIVYSCVDITELADKREYLEDMDRFYRKFVESSPDMIGIHRDGIIQYVNSACVRLLGARQPEELTGRHILDFIHPSYRSQTALNLEKIEHIRKTEKSGENQETLQSNISSEEVFLTLDGRALNVELFAFPVTLGGTPHTFVVARDVTEKKVRKRIAAGLKNLEENISCMPDIEKALSSSLDLLLEISGMDTGSAYLWNSNENAFMLVCSKGIKKENEIKIARYEENSLKAKIIFEGRPVFSRMELFGTQFPEFIGDGLTVVGILPFFIDGKVAGCFDIASHTMAQVAETTRENLEVLVIRISNILSRIWNRIGNEKTKKPLNHPGRLPGENSCPAVNFLDIRAKTGKEEEPVKFINSDAPGSNTTDLKVF